MQMRGKKEAFFFLTQSLETIRLFYLLKEGLEPSTAVNKLGVCFNSFKKNQRQVRILERDASAATLRKRQS